MGRGESGGRRALCVAALAMGAALCRGEDVALEVQPGAIAVLPSYTELSVLVRLKNSSSGAVRKAGLTWLTNDGFRVRVERAAGRAAGPGESIVWAVKVENVNGAHLPGAIVFVANCTMAGGGRRDATATLAIAPQGEAGTKSVEAALEGSFDAVTQNRPGEGALTLTNNLDEAVHVEIRPQVPEDVFEPPKAGPVDVPARSSVLVPIHLVARSALTPGAYPVAFQIVARWDAGGHAEQRLLVVSKTATAGIFFESELLKALGVPSFLVLPGCLMIFTAQLLVSLGLFKVKDQSRLPALAVTDPGFWVIAVTLSGVFAWAYSAIRQRNYLVRYGPADLEAVWLWSIALGALAFLIYAGWTNGRRSLHVPGREDSQVQILEKMSRNGIGLAAARVEFAMNGKTMRMFVVEKIGDDQTMVWVTPAIQVNWAATDAGRAAETEFRTLVTANGEPAGVAKKIRDGLSGGLATGVAWETTGAVPNPYHLKVESITGWAAPDRIVTAPAGG